MAACNDEAPIASTRRRRLRQEPSTGWRGRESTSTASGRWAVNASTTSTSDERSRTILLVALGIALALAALLVALVGRGTVRRIGLLIVAVGIGLVVGQNLGPSREPLIAQFGGTMTLRLESPVVATATSPADCHNVVNETEFQVTGDPNMRLDSPNRPFVMVYFNVGDRWAAIEDAPRKNGVRLEITSNEALVPDDEKPAFVGMQAMESSTLEASFSNEGGSMRFAGLAAQPGPGYTGESLDFAGTIEWTCGEALK